MSIFRQSKAMLCFRFYYIFRYIPGEGSKRNKQHQCTNTIILSLAWLLMPLSIWIRCLAPMPLFLDLNCEFLSRRTVKAEWGKKSAPKLHANKNSQERRKEYFGSAKERRSNIYLIGNPVGIIRLDNVWKTTSLIFLIWDVFESSSYVFFHGCQFNTSTITQLVFQ